MYPLKFENVYIEKIWGGRNLENIRKSVPPGKIGESWDVSCHENGESVIKNGSYRGMKLSELIEKEGRRVVGDALVGRRFPLLLKILDAHDKLSIQVHPDDEYAKRENELGKTEAWYVLDVYEDAKLVLGTKDGVSKEEILEGASNGHLEPYLNIVEAKKGSVYFIKSGLLHAMKNVMIMEIQQSSDVTYRVYDYNRGREIHPEQAIEVLDLSIEAGVSRGLRLEGESCQKTYYCYDKNFSLEKYDIDGRVEEESDRERFYIFSCIEGGGKIVANGYEEKLDVGESVLIPAYLGRYELSGRMKCLKSYVPDISKLRKEILSNVEK